MPTFEDQRAWLPWAAGAVLGGICTGVVWPFEAARLAVTFLTGVAVAGALYQAARAFRPRGRYDLERLREVHDKAESKARYLEVPHALAEDVLCPCCGEEYSETLPVCPRCKR